LAQVPSFPEKRGPRSQEQTRLDVKAFAKYLCMSKLETGILAPASCILFVVDMDLRRKAPMDRHNLETVGVRRTGWAALDRDPQQDTVEFICPHCGARDKKNARRERAQYHFTDGFLQDLQGEVTQCHACKQSLRVVPIVMLHDQDETRRFEAVFSDEQLVTSH
jgi:hypothetical protein